MKYKSSVVLLLMLTAFAIPGKKKIKIFMAGDSTMAIKAERAFPETGRGMPFVHFRDSSITVINKAKNGAGTGTLREDGHWQSIMQEAKAGDYVFIQFGHNDEAPTKKSYATREEFKNNLKRFIAETRSKKATPVLLSPVTRRKFDSAGPVEDTHEVYAGLERRVAGEEKVILLEHNQKGLALYQQPGMEQSKKLFLHLHKSEHPNNPDGKEDNTHFSETGAMRVAGLVLNEIREKIPELAERITDPKKNSPGATVLKNIFPIVTKTSKVSIVYDAGALTLDSILAHHLAEDIERVTSFKPDVITDIAKARGNVIVIGSVASPLIQKVVGEQTGFTEKIRGKWESFGLTVVNKPLAAIAQALIVAGSDARGTAYGVYTLSEKAGVSPWYWWADVPVKYQAELVIDQPEYISTPPAVKYRGIFINDEDWGLQPWAAKTYEPETGDIGPKTYAKIFELLLRLKANLIWPAMHPGTKAFFHYPGNLQAAQDYQIIIGSSHAEPMLRNNVSEWDEKTMGRFNYITNKEKVLKYWEDRIKETAGINAVYTLGMRGIHDGQMEGVKDLKDAVPVVERIIADERELLSKYVEQDVTTIPQALTAYKEVLEIYDNGLKVPGDVTLVWPDDNYGYIHRLNNEKEINRQGGAGVYYHASYWGRPHDYLWLPSTHPSLLREEMMKAFETGASRLWVLNVGDIKPQEYNMQQFLDMAWNPAPFTDSRYSKQHLLNWTTAIFGAAQGTKIQSILWEYYQLAFERRPEFMGWSQTEPTTQTGYTEFNHFYFGDEAQKRIDRYSALEAAVKNMRPQISAHASDAFYQLVYYPVAGASWINKKFLYRDKAYFYSKQNRLSAYDYAQLSIAAYDSIVKETGYFNTQLAGGKWKHIMDMSPRRLPVYQPPVMPAINTNDTALWSIAPEGFVTGHSPLLPDKGFMSLPSFDNLNRQKYFVDIFLAKNETIEWNAVTSHTWIRLSENKGTLEPAAGKKQTRIRVDIDWKKFPKNRKINGTITFSGRNKNMVLNLEAIDLSKPGLTGLVENNRFISIHASNFTRLLNKANSQWKIISDLGYTGKVLQAYPLSIENNSVTDPDSIQRTNAVVEYDFYTFSPAAPFVTVFALPTHSINNNHGVRYAISIDGGPLTVVDIKTFGRSGEWKQNVLRNRAERKIQMPFLEAGKHTLKVFAIDPGIMLDEIRIDLGGLKKAYSKIPETRTLHDR